jgi:transcriptional regulator with XRE-family HTH domain
VPSSGSPTARRRELGTVLRLLRTGTGMTAEVAAGRVGFSPSKLSRLENGRRGASPVDIDRLCELYQVDEEQRQRLTALAAEGKQRAWWPRSLPYSDYVGLEAEAASISDYGLAIVPGLLQTSDYARAILHGFVPALTPEAVEESVQARIARQRLLSAESAPIFEAILDESVLHRVVGSSALMLAQLQQLLDISRLPNVTIRVIPYQVGAVPSPLNKFVILRFTRPDIADVVLIEALTDTLYLDGPEEIATYDATFRTLADLAAGAAASGAMILAKMAAYGAHVS